MGRRKKEEVQEAAEAQFEEAIEHEAPVVEKSKKRVSVVGVPMRHGRGEMTEKEAAFSAGVVSVRCVSGAVYEKQSDGLFYIANADLEEVKRAGFVQVEE